MDGEVLSVAAIEVPVGKREAHVAELVGLFLFECLDLCV